MLTYSQHSIVFAQCTLYRKLDNSRTADEYGKRSLISVFIGGDACCSVLHVSGRKKYPTSFTTNQSEIFSRSTAGRHSNAQANRWSVFNIHSTHRVVVFLHRLLSLIHTVLHNISLHFFDTTGWVTGGKTSGHSIVFCTLWSCDLDRWSFD